MLIRTETSADYPSIREINIHAFENHPISTVPSLGVEGSFGRGVAAILADRNVMVDTAETLGDSRGHEALHWDSWSLRYFDVLCLL